MPESNEPLEKLLVASLQRVIDFVKFAEAKHAVLVTLASGWSLAITTLLAAHPEYPPLTAYTMQFARAAYVFALFTSIWSFLPKRKLELFYREPPDQKNLLFFGHLASIDLSILRKELSERYGNSGDGQAYIHDLSCQIGINSIIADRKFLLFNRAAAILMLGVALLAIPTAINLLQWLCAALGGAQ